MQTCVKILQIVQCSVLCNEHNALPVKCCYAEIVHKGIRQSNTDTGNMKKTFLSKLNYNQLMNAICEQVTTFQGFALLL